MEATMLETWFDIVKCGSPYCRRYVNRKTAFEYDGRYYCESCKDDEFRECVNCNEISCVDLTTFSESGDSWCEPCAMDYLTYCERCEEYYEHRYTYFHEIGYETWCENCASNHAYWCDECGSYGSEPCYDHEGQEGDLLPYDYKPQPIFHGAPAHGLYLGLELECEDKSGSSIADAVQYIHSNWDYENVFYCKHDGSLQAGMEIVSHPASLEWWQARGFRLETLTKELKGKGFRSWDTSTSGIHIHVSADAFDNDTHLYKFSQLFYKNPERMQKFAGRGSTHYAEYSEGRLVYELIKQKKREGGRAFGKRYTAVNLNNKNTVEIRIFRGTLNHERILANLELVHAAVEYTREITVRDALDGALDFGAFRMWAARQGNYPHMMKIIRARVTNTEDSKTNIVDPFERTA